MIEHPAPQRLGFPVSFSPLIGREREIAQIRELIGRPSVPLLTLTGPAGTGKTRLAISVAAELDGDYADGALFVPLAAITDSDLVIPTIAQALGIWTAADRPLIESVTAKLQSKRMLLVLDNFEQVIGAASHVSRLLSASPGIKLLITSRVVLRVSGEQEYLVPPMTLPEHSAGIDLETLSRIESVSLFLQRARAVKPGFAFTEANAPAIVELCRRLDGLPLAIELAAARAKVLSPNALLARLTNRLQVLTGGARDAPPRLQSMRDAIGWSYELLDAGERQLFRRLSVFAGGFDLDAASAVMGGLDERSAGDHDDSSSALDGIASLVDKSLLKQAEGLQAEPRFLMLETIRDYALEQLAGDEDGSAASAVAHSPVSPVRDAHASWYLGLAEELQPRETGVQDERALQILEQDHDNLRAALAWLERSQQAERLLQLAGALGWFWYVHGHLTEGRAWLKRAIEADRSHTASSRYRARAVRMAGKLAWLQADYASAVALLTEAQALSATLGDGRGLADALSNLGAAYEKQGNEDEAMRLNEEALLVYRGVGDEAGVASTLIDLADAAFRQGDLVRSQALSDEAFALSTRLGDKALMALAYVNDGQLQIARDAPAAAYPRFRQSLILAAELGHGWLIANALGGLALVSLDAGDAVQGARWLGAARALCDSLGTPNVPHHALFNRASDAVRSGLGEQGFLAAFDGGRKLSPHQAVAEVLRWEYNPGQSPKAAAPPALDRAKISAFGLTDRELEVLALIVEGKSSREIGDTLFISPRTATTHVANILGKLGVNSRSAAVALAFQHGIV